MSSDEDKLSQVMKTSSIASYGEIIIINKTPQHLIKTH
jgi:hypothetical protein